ncbi:hypothetical protein VTN00DRAFT_6120 [Thermoascus crustaceus]|uniref:uncharacterized protein n=1 Tax=Thermoascus crustaceus TaxID=5088 RepID=UPI003742F2C8
MIIRSLFAAGALSLGASAFLVVPELDTSVQPPETVRHFDAHNAHSQEVRLACIECPFPEVGANGKISWTDGFDTSLALNFSTEDGRLLVNDRQIMPPPAHPLSVQAVLRRESDGLETDPISLGSALEVMPIVAAKDDPGAQLLSVRFTVLDLAGHPVPLETVAMAVINTSEGQLYIARTEVEETGPDRLSWKQCRGEPKCLRRLLFARLRALIAGAKARMMRVASRLPISKGCHGKPRLMQGHPSKHLPDGERPPFWRHGGLPHRPHHHMHHSGWERTFSRIVRFIVIPAVLGVLAGLVASAIGMLVGQVIVFLWHRYRRCGTDRSTSTVEYGTDTEKEALMAESPDDLPPQYDEEDHGVISLPTEKQ